MDAPIYTLGYLNWTPESLAIKLVQLDAVLIDIRINPTSRRPGFRQKAIQNLVGERYVSIRDLGNMNYRNKSAPFKIRDYQAGRHILMPHLNPGPVVLMCACRLFDRCHRSLLATRLQKELAAEIFELPHPGSDPVRIK